MKILLNDFRRQWSQIGDETLRVTARVGASGWYVLGEELRQFEDSLAATCRLPYAVGVGNGMDAIEIGLRCLGLRPGDRVLTTPLSAFATTLAILRCGGRPVFADVDATGLIDLRACSNLLSQERERRNEIRFFVPVHLYGHALDLGKLESIRDEFSLSVVEDCAQAIRARSGGRYVGGVGQVAAFSFYPTKNLGALGDGGALLTTDEMIAQKARALRHYGQTATYVHSTVGLNSRLDEIHAAILREVLLKRLSAWTLRRSEIAARYRAGIRHAEIVVPPVPAISESVWHLFPLLVPADERKAFRRHLADKGVASAVHYPTIIPDQPALESEPPVPGLERARAFARCEVSIPIHPQLSDEEASVVVEACNSWKVTP